jgi:hypothetical protein
MLPTSFYVCDEKEAVVEIRCKLVDHFLIETMTPAGQGHGHRFVTEEAFSHIPNGHHILPLPEL